VSGRADAVVIGSGPNGLAAAIRLAEAGREVVVLEAAPHAGGAVQTQELTLPGFLHDPYSSVYPAGAASPVFARMPLAEHGLEWVHPEACYATPLPGDRAAVLYRSLEDTRASLDALHPGDGASWEAFVAPFLKSWDGIRSTMLAGFPPVGGPLKLLGQAGPLGTLQFARLVAESTIGLGKRVFDGGAARAWLYGAAMHGDTPPDRPGGAIAAMYLNLMGHAVGWPSPRGGAGRLSGALISYLESLGGTVRTGARVVGVTAAGGRVTGVTIDGGERIEAATVIADVMPHALAGLAGDALSGWYRSLLKRYVYGPSTLKVDWALDGPIPWTNEAVRTAGTVHVSGLDDELLETIATSEHALPDRPFLLLGQQSVADPTRAPEGKHTAWAYTHGPHDGVLWDPDATALQVERVEAQVERYAPGFRDRILARHVMSPSDLQARNANLVAGDVGGGSYTFRQLIFRPVPSVSPYRTPLKGLFLGSAATFPGGAVHGVPGDAAAAASLRRGPF
jgi:phytoene dehydrogenase-like protein